MKGYITACFLLTNTAGNFLNTFWMPYYGGSLADPPDKRGLLLPGPFFAITAAFIVAATIGFFFIGKRFERANEEQKKARLAL
jgi:hypothetical protein